MQRGETVANMAEEGKEPAPTVPEHQPGKAMSPLGAAGRRGAQPRGVQHGLQVVEVAVFQTAVELRGHLTGSPGGGGTTCGGQGEGMRPNGVQSTPS